VKKTTGIACRRSDNWPDRAVAFDIPSSVRKRPGKGSRGAANENG
jgi:hypothetical protein